MSLNMAENTKGEGQLIIIIIIIIIILIFVFVRSGRTIMALFVHLFYIMAAFSHLRAAFSDSDHI